MDSITAGDARSCCASSASRTALASTAGRVHAMRMEDESVCSPRFVHGADDAATESGDWHAGVSSALLLLLRVRERRGQVEDSNQPPPSSCYNTTITWRLRR